MVKRFLCLTAMLFAAAAGAADLSAASIARRLASHPTVLATFHQTRHLADADLTLQGQGKLFVRADRGVVWTQTEPFTQRLVLTDKALTLSVEGDTPVKIAAKDNPAAFAFVSLLGDMMRVNVAALSANFTMHAQAVPNNHQAWRLTLSPKTEPLNRILSHITIDGTDTIQSVDIREKGGNETHLEMSDFVFKPTAQDDEFTQFVP